MHRFDLDRIGDGLIVADARPALERGIASGAMVVTAPPGTGKTTFVPPLIANQVGDIGRVLLSQPRRVAVRSAAQRIAELDGSQLGDAVGFTVRGERRVSRATQLEVLTPGVLLRRLLSDPGLEGVGAVILDEVHERSLESDLLLGMMAEVRDLRDDLLIVAMSATLDADRVSEILGSAPVLRIPSALHPLAVQYAPFDGQRLDERGVTRPYLAHLADVTVDAQRDAGCDALVFVPGAREVDDTVRLVRARLARSSTTPRSEQPSIEVIPLHGRLSARDQDLAVHGRGPEDNARIVVTTALAESSLTVPGVHLVIDSGLSREVRRDRARDMTGLITVSASRASAEQRAGRAARTGPGRVVRVYSEADFARMPAASPPEIASADLTDAALILAAWGTPEGKGLALPTAPPPESMGDALRVLGALELIEKSGHPTALGRRVAQLPIGVREARALLEGTRLFRVTRTAAEVVAAVSDDHREPGADLTRLLRQLHSGRSPGSARWKRECIRLERIAADALGETEQATSHGVEHAEMSREEASATILALARPEWIARRTGAHSRSYLLASGTRAALPEGSGLIGHEWISVGEVQRATGRAADGTGAVIRLAAPLTEARATQLAANLMSVTRTVRIDEGRVQVREERRLGTVLLSSTPTEPHLEDAQRALAAQLRDRGLNTLRWSDTATSLRRRVGLLHRTLGDPWPNMTDESLLDHLDEWLLPALGAMRPNADIRSIDLVSGLKQLLPWPAAARLDELAPEHLRVPSGSHIRIDYPDAADQTSKPVVAVKLQEVFGLAETPRLVEGRVQILFHLLSPARRPLAVTDDLASFWNGPYHQVRSEMRGRYPRHPWPEDPWTSEATSRTKPR